MSTVDASGNKHGSDGKFAGHVAAESPAGLEPVGAVAGRVRDALERAAHQQTPVEYEPEGVEFITRRKPGSMMEADVDVLGATFNGRTFHADENGVTRIPLGGGATWQVTNEPRRLEWFDAAGRLHRDDGQPASFDYSRGVTWARHGKAHRDPGQGPAMVTFDDWHEDDGARATFAVDGQELAPDDPRLATANLDLLQVDKTRGVFMVDDEGQDRMPWTRLGYYLRHNTGEDIW